MGVIFVGGLHKIVVVKRAVFELIADKLVLLKPFGELGASRAR